MSVDRLEVLVEEPSMEAALTHLLPPLLGEIDHEIFTFKGKSDLLSKLPNRLRGYARFLPDTSRILVLVDRDNDDCIALKARLERMAAESGLVTRSVATNGRYNVTNRVAIEELEAWYFGDWDAVRQAYPKIDSRWTSRTGYRNPDAVAGGTWEAFERIARQAGYFKGGLRKVEAANRIAPLLVPKRNTSRSFQCFLNAIQELVTV